MRQLFLQKGKVFLHDVPVPNLEDNNLLIKVCYSFISSGTELATISTSQKSVVEKFSENSEKNIKKVIGAVKVGGVSGAIALIREKLGKILPLGYSCSGQVIAVGKNITNFSVGDYVACAGTGFANHSDVVSVPMHLVTKISDRSVLKQASLTTIGTIAMQAVRRASICLGENVCILGLGLIGQITLKLAKLSGAKVFGIDIQNSKLELAQKNGADFIFNSLKQEVISPINFATKFKGVDTTIITASSLTGEVIDLAMNITRRKGKVILVGDVKIDFKREPFYSKEIDFLISCSYGPGRYDKSYENNGIDYPYSYVRWTENRNMELFVDLLEKKKLNLDFLTDQVFDIKEAEDAYNFLKSKKILGAVLSFEKDNNKSFLQAFNEQIQIYGFKNNKVNKENNLKAIDYLPPQKETKLGFIGVGGFAKIMLLPIFSKARKTNIHTIIDTNSSNLLNIANLYNIKRIGNKYKKLLVEDAINLIVIATPHKFHFKQTIEALKAGKAVFVEKPAVVNFEELEQLKRFFRINKNSFYCVDFNRSFAPFNLLIKDELSRRTNPIMINYRVNTGFLPKDHWIQDSENGGRVIGEACHIFELFCFLTDAMPISVSVESLKPANSEIYSTDNFIATIAMNDGSCCSLVYSDIGGNSMGKERMEIFFDGKSIVMDDYISLKGYGLPLSFNRKVKYQDKGHKYLISEFLTKSRIKGAKSPIPVERILTASRLSLIVNKLIKQKGGFEKY